jgi:hypothetical protein
MKYEKYTEKRDTTILLVSGRVIILEPGQEEEYMGKYLNALISISLNIMTLV